MQAAFTDYHVVAAGARSSAQHLSERLRQAWQVRHSSPDHRTQLGALLPGLIRDAQGTAFDAGQIVSVPRRSRHFIEVARAYLQRDEATAAFTMLNKSEEAAPETIRYNGFAREMLHELLKHPPSGLRDDVRELSRRVGVAA
ncbi:hypothetical protein DFR68_12440 [Nocardia mexicana]|uniref:Uncharacterized protein n=1 Tax=Nocardia mexicana TaxID=279262 RepID=A0A370GGI9_9NOCA|nr:hypothetical protein DFR68_12440 [Nocardia mexicana]